MRLHGITVTSHHYELEITDDIKEALEAILVTRDSKIKITEEVVVYLMEEAYTNKAIDADELTELKRDLGTLPVDDDNYFTLCGSLSTAEAIIKDYLNNLLWNQKYKDEDEGHITTVYGVNGKRNIAEPYNEDLIKSEL
jgi:signal recognition particle GTPase